MNDIDTVSDKLKQKSIKAKARLAEDVRVKENNSAFGSVKGQFRLTVLASIVTGGFVFFVLDSFVCAEKIIEQGDVSLAISAGVLAGLGIIFSTATFIARWYADQYEEKLSLAENLKGETQGVVTGLRKEIRGALSQSAGWVYTPVFSVEYEVSGKTYSTDWEMPYATNDEKMLLKSERKHMGEIVPIKFDLNSPDKAMTMPPEGISISKVICLLTAYLGFGILAFFISAALFVDLTVLVD